MENPEQTENNPQPPQSKFTFVDVIAANVKVEVALSIFEQINFDVIEEIIDKTPEDIKGTTNYLVLIKVRDFYRDVKNIFVQEQKRESLFEKPTAQ